MSGGRLTKLSLAIALSCVCAGVASAAVTQRTLASPSAPAAVSVDALVAAAVAGDYAKLDRIADNLRAAPRPQRGDRRLARDLNDRGLALWRRQRFGEAAVYFRQAHDADTSDPEIVENLGYSLFKSGQAAESETAILTALTLSPDRASAWGTLGMLRAKAGRHAEGVACVLTAYRFARDPRRTLDVYSRLAVSDEDPRIRALLSDVVGRLSSAQTAPKRS